VQSAVNEGADQVTCATWSWSTAPGGSVTPPDTLPRYISVLVSTRIKYCHDFCRVLPLTVLDLAIHPPDGAARFHGSIPTGICTPRFI
jgi:hypothetical protein